MKRLLLAGLLPAALALAAPDNPSPRHKFTVVEASIADMQLPGRRGRETNARFLVRHG